MVSDGIARNTGGSLSKIVCFLKDHFKHIWRDVLGLLGESSPPIDPGGKVGCGEEANLFKVAVLKCGGADIG